MIGNRLKLILLLLAATTAACRERKHGPALREAAQPWVDQADPAPGTMLLTSPEGATAPKCIPRPGVDQKFNFILGGQSNAQFLPVNVLLAKIQAVFQGIIKPTNIRVHQYARGGTSLAVDWKPNGRADNVGDGPTYRDFQAALLPPLHPAPDGKPVVSGMFWIHGERDSSDAGRANAYGVNLRTFIQDVRLTFGYPLMPFVLSRISVKQTDPRLVYLKTVRKTQENIPMQVAKTKTVDIDGAEVRSDRLHFTLKSYDFISVELAKTMKNLLFPGLANGLKFCSP